MTREVGPRMLKIRRYTGERKLTPTQATGIVWLADLAAADDEAGREREWRVAIRCPNARLIEGGVKKLARLGLVEMRYHPRSYCVEARATDAGIAATTVRELTF